MIDFQSSHKILLTSKIIEYLNIFHILQGSQFCLYIVIFSEFYSDRDIEMGHFIFRTISSRHLPAQS